jgi:hypothetical protein
MAILCVRVVAISGEYQMVENLCILGIRTKIHSMLLYKSTITGASSPSSISTMLCAKFH